MFKPPDPLIRSIECFAGDLPVNKIGFFLLISVAFNAKIFVLLANTLHFAEGEIQVVRVQIVQRCDRDNQVKAVVFPGQINGIANLQSVANFWLGIGNRIIRNIDAINFSIRDNFEKVMQKKPLSASNV